ncbi:hypothetical protein [Chitinophaga ginsengisoli]|uniref:Uncharacterized protein n=1 Tax=Chitinophaga ginsengisoli TaxID=363837 RepID=A0A2P8GHU0_9BACT|nr:hypothetical protein [Chitinophaga ginsengisoli]PSL33541.1 hypothetical protein CLV42_103524 [Chitinophaga ginsengisoli]
MKKAKLLLALVGILAISGGIVAFKVAKFNSTPVWRSTTYITSLVGTKTYKAVGPYCTSTAPTTLFIPAPGAESFLATVSTTLNQVPANVTATATDGSQATTLIQTFPCTTTTTFVTNVI